MRRRAAPIPKAEIRTFVQGDTENRTHTADEKGVFVLDLTGFAPEYVRIMVRPGGYVAQWVELWDVREQSLPRTVRFSLEKGTVIGGVVQDRAGQPIKGASVETRLGGEPQQRFEQPRVSGCVVDSAGKPVEEVSVSADNWNGSNTIQWQGKTDPNGRFVWNYAPADAVRISLYKGGYVLSGRDVVANDQEQTFVLAKVTTIRGAVTDSRTGEPIRQFQVVPGSRWNDGSRISWNPSETATKWFTDGRYNYTFLFDAQAYAVRIKADGYLPFHDQALPQAGMDRIKAVTDENGRFAFEKVYPGKFMLYNETYRVERDARLAGRSDRQGD